MSEATASWIERVIYAVVASTALFVGYHIMRQAEDGIRASERATWARAQCMRLAGQRLRDWTLTQSDGSEVFLRCKFDPRGL